MLQVWPALVVVAVSEVRMTDSLRILSSYGYRNGWLNFRAWLAIRIKRDAERLSWWVNP